MVELRELTNAEIWCSGLGLFVVNNPKVIDGGQLQPFACSPVTSSDKRRVMLYFRYNLTVNPIGVPIWCRPHFGLKPT